MGWDVDFLSCGLTCGVLIHREANGLTLTGVWRAPAQEKGVAGSCLPRAPGAADHLQVLRALHRPHALPAQHCLVTDGKLLLHEDYEAADRELSQGLRVDSEPAARRACRLPVRCALNLA